MVQRLTPEYAPSSPEKVGTRTAKLLSGFGSPDPGPRARVLTRRVATGVGTRSGSRRILCRNPFDGPSRTDEEFGSPGSEKKEKRKPETQLRELAEFTSTGSRAARYAPPRAPALRSGQHLVCDQDEDRTALVTTVSASSSADRTRNHRYGPRTSPIPARLSLSAAAPLRGLPHKATLEAVSDLSAFLARIGRCKVIPLAGSGNFPDLAFSYFGWHVHPVDDIGDGSSHRRVVGRRIEQNPHRVQGIALHRLDHLHVDARGHPDRAVPQDALYRRRPPLHS